jgi:hypothetical protein
MRDGYIDVPTGAGLEVNVDQAMIDRSRVL